MWTLVFPLIRGRGAADPFPSSFPLLLALVRALSGMIPGPAAPWSLGRASLNQMSNKSEMGFHLPYSEKLGIIESQSIPSWKGFLKINTMQGKSGLMAATQDFALCQVVLVPGGTVAEESLRKAFKAC